MSVVEEGLDDLPKALFAWLARHVIQGDRVSSLLDHTNDLVQ